MKSSLLTALRVAAVGAALTTVALGSPAQAATAQAAAAPPPSCATLTKNATATVLTVRNNCQTSTRLRVVVSSSVISSCSLYAPGAVRVITVPSSAPDARLEAC